MRERWLSGRAVALHVALLVIVPGCAIAAWWQINRAQDGNQLSYVYSVMWPVFALLAIVFWWMLVQTDYDTVGLKGMRRRQSTDAGGPPSSAAPRRPLGPADTPADNVVDSDPELAAYNARLAGLAEKGPKTWRRREEVVVRRPQ